MTRILSWGAEWQTELEADEVGKGTGNTVTDWPTPGRAGVSGTRWWRQTTPAFGGSGTYFMRRNFPSSTEIYLAVWLAHNNGGSTTDKVKLMDSSGNTVMRIAGAVGGTLTCYDGSGNNLGNLTGTLGAAPRLVEIHFKLDDTVGEIEVKLNGSAAFTFSGDTNPAALSDVARIYFSNVGPSTNQYIDDLAINDTSGSVNNSWIGDEVGVLLKPNGNGGASDMTGSDGDSTDNYLLVDDFPHDSDATYIAAATTGLKDLFEATALPALPTLTQITSVQPAVIARRADAATPANIDVILVSGATEDASAPIPINTGYQIHYGTIYEADPDDSAPWDEPKVNALEFGVESS